MNAKWNFSIVQKCGDVCCWFVAIQDVERRDQVEDDFDLSSIPSQNTGSRIQNDFEELEQIGKGGFGAVIKVCTVFKPLIRKDFFSLVLHFLWFNFFLKTALKMHLFRSHEVRACSRPGWLDGSFSKRYSTLLHACKSKSYEVFSTNIWILNRRN